MQRAFSYLPALLGKVSKQSRCTCVWKEGGFYFKEEKVPYLMGLEVDNPLSSATGQ